MPAPSPLLRSKTAPPRAARRTLARPRLMRLLGEALEHPVTILQAATGYGKSTTLAAFVAGEIPVSWAWYTVSEDDAEPARFLAYLIEALRLRLPDFPGGPAARLAEAARLGEGWTRVVDALANALDECARDVLLVIDDYHFAADAPAVQRLLDRLLANLPPRVHLLIATRIPLASSALPGLRARGEVLELSADTLAFQPEEIRDLFERVYGLSLDAGEIDGIARISEGWPMGLQLVWQSAARADGAQASPEDRRQRIARAVAGERPAGRNALFEYLARDVLRALPATLQAFLLDASVLRELTPAACDAVTGTGGAGETLRRLHESGLFVVGLGEQHYRFHVLFHDFLRAQLARVPDRAERLQRRAAAHYRALGDAESAARHALAARDDANAADDIERAGRAALEAGRLKAVAEWLAALPAELTAARPALQLLLGDIARLRSRFEDAEGHYTRAEQIWRERGDLAGVGQALRARVTVYLDTVQPARAESLLLESMRLSGGDAPAEHARMLEMLAENRLNAGHPEDAERLRSEAQAARGGPPVEDTLSVRIKLRTGRIDEARGILEGWLAGERAGIARGEEPPPRSHRETMLVLSLIDSLRGEAGRALALAEEGIALSERLDAPFMTAVARARLGHAQQLNPATRDAAIDNYQTAMGLAERLAVRRFRAEPLWGLTRAYGLAGDLPAARRAAGEGIEIARWAGDAWMAAHIQMALGASLAAAGQSREALAWLEPAGQGFAGCGDVFGVACADVWRGLAHLDRQQIPEAVACADAALSAGAAGGYEFLWLRPTLIGPTNSRRLVPLLIETRRSGQQAAAAARMLERIGLPNLERHPGYALRVQTLGAFRTWRGEQEIEPREWQRDKARQLFQLFLTARGQPLQREAITERLWPSLSQEAAQRDFKVALNAMYKALEPARPADAPSAYIARDGTAYWLREEADLVIDALTFERDCETALSRLDVIAMGGPAFTSAIEALETALAAYRGEYLPEALYDDWARAQRERLLALYLRGSERLAAARLVLGQPDAALRLCEAIVARDPCWEGAYRLMMAAQAALGNRAQALRAYQRCADALRAELNVAPSPATEAVRARVEAGV
ncbi:MAG TPA: BTAD domain-containing putative transcriptional regulator [Thermoflexales bacterium]|nr:BTAD domain-containing putative transcriptional regulator [Thermoflexales bacterium]